MDVLAAPASLPTRIRRRADVDRAVAHLQSRDRDLDRAVRLAGPVAFRMRRPGFESLLKIVIEQQLSTASAWAIWARMVARVDPLTPQAVLRTSDRAFRAVGLSGPKIRYCRALSASVAAGELRLDKLSRLADDEAMTALTSVTGIGRWTAEIYLLFCLGRPDVWPVGDVAVQSALQSVRGLPSRPDADAMETLGRRWRPVRGVAALILWNYYRHLKGRPVWR